jgi:hypothetical protein
MLLERLENRWFFFRCSWSRKTRKTLKVKSKPVWTVRDSASRGNRLQSAEYKCWMTWFPRTWFWLSYYPGELAHQPNGFCISIFCTRYWGDWRWSLFNDGVPPRPTPVSNDRNFLLSEVFPPHLLFSLFLENSTACTKLDKRNATCSSLASHILNEPKIYSLLVKFRPTFCLGSDWLLHGTCPQNCLKTVKRNTANESEWPKVAVSWAR